MPDFVLAHTQKWLDHFTQQGHRASPLAAGVEGAIYDLGGDWRFWPATQRPSFMAILFPATSSLTTGPGRLPFLTSASLLRQVTPGWMPPSPPAS